MGALLATVMRWIPHCNDCQVLIRSWHNRYIASRSMAEDGIIHRDVDVNEWDSRRIFGRIGHVDLCSDFQPSLGGSKNLKCADFGRECGIPSRDSWKYYISVSKVSWNCRTRKKATD